MSATLLPSYLRRTTGLLDYNSPYTVMAWFYLFGFLPAQNLFTLSYGDDGNSPRNYDTFQVNPEGYKAEIRNNAGSQSRLSDAPFIGINQWFHFAGVRTSTSDVEAYENGISLPPIPTLSIADRVSSAPVARQNVGAFSDLYLDIPSGYVAHIFEYSAALSQAEIQNQMFKAQPQRTANLHAWTPCRNGARTIDFSGNGRDWTEIGAMTDGIIEPPVIYAPPPMVVKSPPILVYFNSPGMLLAC